jgi:hypothetical protein
VRAGELNRPGYPALPRGLVSWKALVATWVLFVAVVLWVAGLVAVVTPDWLPGGTRHLPDSPRLMADIFANNLLIALLPLLGGWFAAGYLLSGHGFVARLFLLAPGLIVARSLVTIGAVGGADPAWLATAARWWLLELAALASSACTGFWLARNPGLRDRCGPAVMRPALGIVVASLGVAAVVEVLTA